MPLEEIERLYNVFSRYSRPTQLEGCPCCTSPAEAQSLVSKTLRALTAPELEHYAFKALTTWGTLNDYKYFLPRILELTEDGSLLCDTEITLHKLHYGGFCDWPPDERQAVRDYVFGVWLFTLRTLIALMLSCAVQLRHWPTFPHSSTTPTPPRPTSSPLTPLSTATKPKESYSTAFGSGTRHLTDRFCHGFIPIPQTRPNKKRNVDNSE